MRFVICLILSFICIREIVIFFEDIEKEEDKLIAQLCICIFKIAIIHLVMSVASIISIISPIEFIYQNSTLRVIHILSIFLFMVYLYYIDEFYNLGGFDNQMMQPILMIESAVFLIIFLLQNRKYETFGLMFCILGYNFKSGIFEFLNGLVASKIAGYNDQVMNANYSLSLVNTF